MLCKSCGVESDLDWEACPNCGQGSQVAPTPVGAPGSVGPARANGSDEVRNSGLSSDSPVPAKLENAGRVPRAIVEGAGG
jgi:hypothetical protein